MNVSFTKRQTEILFVSKGERLSNSIFIISAMFETFEEFQKMSAIAFSNMCFLVFYIVYTNRGLEDNKELKKSLQNKIRYMITGSLVFYLPAFLLFYILPLYFNTNTSIFLVYTIISYLGTKPISIFFIILSWSISLIVFWIYAKIPYKCVEDEELLKSAIEDKRKYDEMKANENQGD